MNKTNPKVDGYLRKNQEWGEVLSALRGILLDCGLTEDIKWRAPCYTFEGNNVVIIGAAKDHCALSFMKGSLLKDARGILEKPGPNSRAARLIRFTTVGQIAAVEAALRAYIGEAIEAEKAGLKVDFQKDAVLPVPAEVQHLFVENPELKAAFEALTPGRQRGYLLHFSAPKQSKTRTARVERCMPRIFEGKGLLDR